MAEASDIDLKSSFSHFVGRTRERTDLIDLNRALALHAALGIKSPEPRDGTALSPLGHWVYFWECNSHNEMGPDGHPHRGDFLPPIPFPRRMWAGSRVRFLEPLRVGSNAWRRSRIKDVKITSGRSGRLAIVTVGHEIGQSDSTAIEDEQDIIYRDGSINSANAPIEHERQESASVERVVKPDEVLLFRYSALTYNAHRIHYDRDYAVGQEGYPGLVVHGPLLATLMLQCASELQPSGTVRSFDFRAHSPIFDLNKCCIGARASSSTRDSVDTWIHDHRGALAFKGVASF